MDGFNYYSFMLNGKEYIYYTYVENDTAKDIIEWAERFSLIKESDICNCSNARALSPEEVDLRNKNLYKKWWVERESRRINGEDVTFDCIPPTIGGVQLN